MFYTVGEAAKQMGVSASTLRYYDKEGLLPFVGRSDGGIRLFKDSDFEWLRVIECLKKTGMQLTDIRQFVEMEMYPDLILSKCSKMPILRDLFFPLNTLYLRKFLLS